MPYSNDDRIYWVNMLMVAGKDRPSKDGVDYSISNVAKMPGSPSGSTLRRWWEQHLRGDVGIDPNANSRQRLALKEALAELLGLHIDRSTELVPDSTSLRDVNLGIGILYDKYALVAGKPTSITAMTDVEKVRDMLQDGTLTQAQVRERWPSLADQLFGPITTATTK